MGPALRPRGLPRAARVGLAAGSGLVLSLAFPPWDAGWLAYIGLVPLLLSLEGATAGEAAGLGFLSGLVFYLATVWWVVNTMTTYGRMPLALSLLALLLLAGVLAGYTAAFAWLLALGRRRLAWPEGLWPAAAAALWTALELLRTYLFSGFPWALLGYTQYRQPTVRLLAAAVGVYGISGLLVLANGTLAGLAALLLHLRERSPGWRQAGVALALLAAAGLATLGYGRLLWRDPTGGPALRVGLLQGNIDQSIKWDPGFQQATLADYEGLARRLLPERPALIVWPEAAAPFLLQREDSLGLEVRRFVAEAGVPMLIGGPYLAPDGTLRNSAFYFGPDGTLRGRYDKRHLVPFGEYVPLQSVLFFLHKLVVGIGDFLPGHTATVFRLDGVRFSVMICYEVIFPEEVRQFAERGAEFLVNITNDAWFGRSGAPAQHLAMAALRAVENGSYLVRAANTGITAVIGPTGQILDRTAIFSRAALLGTIRPRLQETPYTRHGDVLAWACLLFLAGYVLMLLLSRRAGNARPGAGAG